MKQLFFLLIILLSFFNEISYAADNGILSSEVKNQEKINIDINKKLLSLDKNIPFLNQQINANKKEVTELYNKIDGNKIKIKKNEWSINGINKALDTTGGLLQSSHEQITEIKETTRINEKILSGQVHATENYQLEIEKLNHKFNKLQHTTGLTHDYLDRFWVMISAALVFLMQAGFKTYESGMVRKRHEDNVAIKNLLDWLVISLCFFTIGFGIMFGESFYGLFGTNFFAPTAETMQTIKETIIDQYLGLEFFLYELAFAATAATIVSGALSERIALIPYILFSAFIGCVGYPLFGHWAWGGRYLRTEDGWLYAIGFRDFSGATVVHSIGAWVALAGVMVIGPRIGRFDRLGNVNNLDFTPSNLGYSTLGVLILWFGFWGFNGGGAFKYDESVATIILNTNISGSTAGIVAFFHAMSKSRDKYEIFPKLLGGVLGGLVAITACCNSVSSWEAAFIGAMSGLIYNYSHDFLTHKLKMDDPVGAIASHGACGVWGTLCVALFAQLDTDFFSQNGGVLFSEQGLLSFLADTNIRIKQLIVQLIGILTAFVYAFPASYLFFNLIRRIPGVGLRVLPADEKSGSILGISN